MLSGIQLVLALDDACLFCPKCEWFCRVKKGTADRKTHRPDSYCPDCGFYIDGVEPNSKGTSLNKSD